MLRWRKKGSKKGMALEKRMKTKAIRTAISSCISNRKSKQLRDRTTLGVCFKYSRQFLKMRCSTD